MPYITITTPVHFTLSGIGSIRKRSNDPENSITDDMVLPAIEEFFTENNEDDTADEMHNFNISHTQIYTRRTNFFNITPRLN
jgi:hypothetical protein